MASSSTSILGHALVPEAARSVIHKPLPPLPTAQQPDADGNLPVTLLLFYQYIEPAWTPKEHKAAVKFVLKLGRETEVCGRGRCAAEGLNCSLTGSAEGIRAFCEGLRRWKPIFLETDFKLTDGVPHAQRFKALTIRKTDELVAYGLAGEKAPSLETSRAQHVEADEYHKMMAEPNTVIIDVRNAYESAIGHFQPPPGGAELLDPKMRNSHEFPKWINAPETREKLQGKKVMMYCTGGIRCERATALLDQLEQTSDLKTEGVVMVRGGIERYVKTFPEGGFWKGKNYLFDRRLEQTPAAAKEKGETESWCSCCGVPWDTYRGQYKCSGKLPPPVGRCAVPVLVCAACIDSGRATAQASTLLCPLCTEGYVPPSQMPALEKAAVKRAEPAAPRASKPGKRLKGRDAPPSTRLFVGSLPLVTDATAVRKALGGSIEVVQWLRDRSSGLFYGSAFVRMRGLLAATDAVEAAASAGGLVLNGRKLRVAFAPPRDGEAWPPPGFAESERPPVG